MNSTAISPDDLQELLRRLAEAPMLGLMKQRLVAASAQEVSVEATPDVSFENSMHRMHGGFVASLIDTTLGFAVMAHLPAKTGYGTVDLNVKFVRKIEIASGVMTARARVLHAGRTMFTATCEVVDAKGVLYAHGSGTFLVYPK